jgi:hypothetical protein
MPRIQILRNISLVFIDIPRIPVSLEFFQDKLHYDYLKKGEKMVYVKSSKQRYVSIWVPFFYKALVTLANFTNYPAITNG